MNGFGSSVYCLSNAHYVPQLDTMLMLTERQKELARMIVRAIREERLGEEFGVVWSKDGPGIIGTSEYVDDLENSSHLTRGSLTSLERADLIQPIVSRSDFAKYVVTSRLYSAVDSDFDEPDTSFVKHLTPLADVSNLDEELKQRCLPILGAGASDPQLWDSAVRTAGVILEERLRVVGGIEDSSRVGRDLVNDVFGQRGTLADCFDVSSERVGYRDLYAGIVGAFRNPSAHRLIDPSPEDGGAFIVFVNLLLKHLEELVKDSR